MPQLPDPGQSLLVRTDFSDDTAWQLVAEEAQRVYEFQAHVVPVGNSAFEGATWEVVRAAVPPNDEGASALFIADATTFASSEHSVLVVDLVQHEGEQLAPFRCIPSELWAVENNLNQANLDWQDFADNTDPDGVYRG